MAEDRLVVLGEHLEQPAVAGQLAVGSTDSMQDSSDTCQCRQQSADGCEFIPDSHRKRHTDPDPRNIVRIGHHNRLDFQLQELQECLVEPVKWGSLLTPALATDDHHTHLHTRHYSHHSPVCRFAGSCRNHILCSVAVGSP